MSTVHGHNLNDWKTFWSFLREAERFPSDRTERDQVRSTFFRVNFFPVDVDLTMKGVVKCQSVSHFLDLTPFAIN